jgi:transcriptional regulator with GAF, ATPase, and Fis domain
MSLASLEPLSTPVPVDFSDAVRRALPVVGRSRAFVEMLALVESLARTRFTVLVTGESGAGKELVARLLHDTGERPGPFLAYNCAAIAEGTLESDLFGHCAGAFTGAVGARRGLFEEADGGTLFLDEIGEIGPRLQAQLLRVLQEGEIKRVGESRVRHVNVRVITATNRNLAAEVRAGRFREDLFYRLNVVQVRVPPLRERTADIPLFLRHFASESVRANEPFESLFTPEALDRFHEYEWPGNVRQLRNEVLRSALFTRGRGPIGRGDLSEEVRGEGPASGSSGSLRERVDGAQRSIVLGTLHQHQWNKTRAARALGITRQGLIKMIHRLGLPLDCPEALGEG